MTNRGQRGGTSPMAADPTARPAAASTVDLALLTRAVLFFLPLAVVAHDLAGV